jgi:bacterioferritin (cytochrome b1)
MVLQERSPPDILENDFIHWPPSKKNHQLQDITKAVREATEPLKAELQALKDIVADQEAQIKALETQQDFEKK